MKQRIDMYLVENGYFQSREQAQRSIMAGEIMVNGKRIEKASQIVAEPLEITISGGQAYVSRGGYKLEKAIEFFDLKVADRICLDAGASTGGFTDYLLKAGAAHVYAVDVGYGQLAWKLRQDDRVTVFERENIRYFAKERIGKIPSIIVADLSFISLELVLPKFRELLAPDGDLITLIKPQFEAGKGKVGKKGVVRDKSVHQEVLDRLFCNSRIMGWVPVNLTFSPILGPEGNLEYLGYWRLNGEPQSWNIEELVDKAWKELK
jgi:23S rRNA (cytidine1920-2'-O)/16S rRNA (cytidine1409-2'-O)-methyltransferase